eukprot:m.15460 g.15460  ORF g.15460 m.15460 type:complete len:419 (-) comp3438_c1_seq1:62-1318(-)
MYSAHRVNYQLRAHRRDEFIELTKALLLTPFVLYAKSENQEASRHLGSLYEGVFARIEELVEDHRKHCHQGKGAASQLCEMVPSIGRFFTSLPLREAFREFDCDTNLTGRRFVPPSFNDIRHILNLAQVMAIAPTLELITFDGDQTLYEDGGNFASDSPLVGSIISLLRRGVRVALVTAAGYAGKPERYEGRLRGLLDGCKDANLAPEECQRFYVLGGECNFLFQLQSDFKLKTLDDEVFYTHEMKSWKQDKISELLDVAEQTIRQGCKKMRMGLEVLRKDRGVGTILRPGALVPRREQLDELVLSCKVRIEESDIGLPFCAFNGGKDVWVDVGNKLIGVQALQNAFDVLPGRTLHVGDQFLSVGNDIATRSACCTVWVSNPTETAQLLSKLEQHVAADRPMAHCDIQYPHHAELSAQ